MPSIQQVYADEFLSNYAWGIITQPDGEFVSGAFAPITPVPKPSGKYRKFNENSRAEMERDKALVRAVHSEVSTSDFAWSEDNYNCEEYAHGTHLSPKELAAADQRPLFEMAKTRYVINVVRQKHEIAFANAFFTTGVWGEDVAFGGAGQPVVWSDYQQSDPIGLALKLRESRKKAGGRYPNRGLCGAAVARALQNHPAIKNVMSVASDRIVPMSLVAKLFGLDSIVVAGATKTTSVEGAASPTFDFIFGRSLLMAYMAANGEPDGLDASAARIFSWTEGATGAPNPQMMVPVERIPRPLNNDERIQASMNWGHKVTGASLGVFLSNCVSADF